MFGATLALVVFTAFLLGHLAVSHLFDIERKERTLVGFMAAAGVTHVLTFFAVPVSTVTDLRVVSRLVDCATGLAALGFLILGYVEFWSLVERSFSLRILIDTAASQRGLTPDEIADRYSTGRGLEWMMKKRIEDLQGAGIVVATPTGHGLSSRGRALARIFRVLQWAFSIT